MDKIERQLLQEIQYKAQGIVQKWRDEDSAPYIEFVEELAGMNVPDPELVRHPPITYTYPSNASRDEQLKLALLALLKSDLIKVAGRKFTKQDLIDWVEKQKEQKPAEYLDKDKVYSIMTKLTNLSYSQLIPINSDEFKKLHEITSEVRDLLDYPIEQKPAEWSEDERIRKEIISALKFANTSDGVYDKHIAWLEKQKRGTDGGIGVCNP